jgi:S-adenosylmethionine decarboxylase proenzyme
MQNALGHHFLIDLYECDFSGIHEVEQVQHALLECCAQLELSVLSHHFHPFEPYGATGVVIISESHMSIHTWPEHGYASCDLYVCKPDINIQKAIAVLQEAFQAKSYDVQEVKRGNPEKFRVLNT